MVKSGDIIVFFGIDVKWWYIRFLFILSIMIKGYSKSFEFWKSIRKVQPWFAWKRQIDGEFYLDVQYFFTMK